MQRATQLLDRPTAELTDLDIMEPIETAFTLPEAAQGTLAIREQQVCSAVRTPLLSRNTVSLNVVAPKRVEQLQAREEAKRRRANRLARLEALADLAGTIFAYD